MGHSWASTSSPRSVSHCDRHLDVAEGIVGANYFPNVPLITQHGATVHFYDDLLEGKAVAINVIATAARTSARWRRRGWCRAEGDPIATALFTRYNAPMPNLSLGAADAASLIEYLESPGDASRKHAQGGE